MTKKERMAETTAKIVSALIFLLLEGLFAALLISSIKGYLAEDITYRELKYEELTFQRYERKSTSRNAHGLLIYFEEYEEPFWISSIAAGEVNRTALNKLITAENQVVRVYFRQGYQSHKGYQHDVCEMVSSADMILGLSEYNEAYRDNDRLGIIMCSVFCVLILLMAWFFLFPVKIRKRLGELQLEYASDGNVIRVYGCRLVCTLMINGDIADQQLRSIRGNFVLKGVTGRGGCVIPVEARFGRANILLYYDGTLSARKLLR